VGIERRCSWRRTITISGFREDVHVYKIGENEIDKAATPVGLKQMVEIFKSADVYVSLLMESERPGHDGMLAERRRPFVGREEKPRFVLGVFHRQGNGHRVPDDVENGRRPLRVFPEFLQLFPRGIAFDPATQTNVLVPGADPIG
jgi:hypothetical protein